jgi:hypothetical protein
MFRVSDMMTLYYRPSRLNRGLCLQHAAHTARIQRPPSLPSDHPHSGPFDRLLALGNRLERLRSSSAHDIIVKSSAHDLTHHHGSLES